MQTLAGRNGLESVRSMPVKSLIMELPKLPYIINQCTVKLNATFSMENDLWLLMTIGRSCRHNVSATYTVYHCQLLCSVSMNPVNNWIQSNASSKFRVEPTSWPRRHNVSVTSAVSCYHLTTVTVRMNWNTNFNSKVSPWNQELWLSVMTWYRLQPFKSTASICTLTTPTTPTQHVHPD